MATEIDKGYHIQVYETNYRFEKRFPVNNAVTVGELMLLIVREIGKKIDF